MNFPHSPTVDELLKGILAIPKVDADPYETVGVWSDGTLVYWIEGDDLYVGVYDRSLDADPQTGVGWRRFALHTSKQAYRFSYDFATLGGAAGTITLTQNDGPLPDDFIVQNVFIDVITPLASGGAATGALTTGQSAGDLVAATAVSGAPWSTTGQKITLPLLGTIATWIKMTAERDPALVVATAALTAGAFNVFVEGYVSA